MRLPDFFINPRAAAIAGVILGLVLGLLIGWVLWPVEYTDGVPGILSQRYQEEYMRMAIDSHRVAPDPDLAVQRWLNLGENALPLYLAISQNPARQDPAAILGFKAAVDGKLESPPAVPVEETPLTSTLNKYLVIGVGALLALAVIGGTVYYFFLRPILYGKRPSTGEISAARHAQEINKSVEKTDFSEKGLEKPITQTMTTYILGDDLYDESFSIDSPVGEFLGEYGVGVSDTMGVGEPKKVTAIEIWLFDKNDVKTATKVLMSQHAFRDQAIRSRLEAKGELVLVQPQGQIILQTATLQLLATVVDLDYGKTNLPDNSYFERVTLELAIWPKR